MEKIELTKEQIEKIAEGISVICFRFDLKTKEYALFEYPKVNIFHQSCVWNDPSEDYCRKKEVRQVFPSFEAEHTYGHPMLFKPSLAEAIQAMPLDLIGKANAFTIKHNGFNADGSKHVSIVTPYLIGEKIVQIPPVKDKKEEKRLHLSPLKVGDLVGTILDEYCQVSIDWLAPDNYIQSAWQGYLNDVPEEYLNKPFRPINIMTDSEKLIHLIIN